MGAGVDAADLRDVRAAHLLRSLRVGAVLRIAVVGLMVFAMMRTARPEWFAQSVLLVCYGVGALGVAALAFFRPGSSAIDHRVQTATAAGDVVAISTYEMLSSGGNVPLLVMLLLPLLVALEVSERRAAVILALSAIAFAVVVIQDPIMQPTIGWPTTIYLCGLFAFLCATAFAVVYVQQRHIDAIARLSASRRLLLTDTMTSFESERRLISEALHDGPLQTVLAARQDISDAAKASDDIRLDRAMTSLRDVAHRLRVATFLLHPAVLEQVGLAEATRKLAAVSAERSGIAFTADTDYPDSDGIDPMVFGVMRELVSNVIRHSSALTASIRLRSVDGMCLLDVADDGVGMTPEVLAHRLGEGHIGIASHRTRVEAAGGTLVFVDARVGTHVRVQVPLSG